MIEESWGLEQQLGVVGEEECHVCLVEVSQNQEQQLGGVGEE